MWTSSRDGFNPRSREGSDHVNSRNRLQILNSFNPRSREGSDETPDIKTAQGKVSIHAPAKGATRPSRAWTSPEHMFQSTLPRRERRQCEVHDDLQNKFQSTLPRRERRCKGGLPRTFPPVSIHAPAKGATKKIRDSAVFGLFQSTLPRRERLYMNLMPKTYNWGFNPRSREGSDEKAKGIKIEKTVSIHAPAKGATPCNFFCCLDG